MYGLFVELRKARTVLISSSAYAHSARSASILDGFLQSLFYQSIYRLDTPTAVRLQRGLSGNDCFDQHEGCADNGAHGTDGG